MERDLVRHGDLLFRLMTPTLAPADAKLTRKAGKVIERGEVTGHAHRITAGDAVILERYEKAWSGGANVPILLDRYLHVQATATVSHEEHGPVTLMPGLWAIMQAREFDYAANLGRRVRD